MDLHLELVKVGEHQVTFGTGSINGRTNDCTLTVPRWLWEDDHEPVIARVAWTDVESTVRAVVRD